MASATILIRAPWFKRLAFLIFVFICWYVGCNGFVSMGAMGMGVEFSDQPEDAEIAFTTSLNSQGSPDWWQLPVMTINLAIAAIFNGLVMYWVITKTSEHPEASLNAQELVEVTLPRASLRVSPAVERVSEFNSPSTQSDQIATSILEQAKQELVDAFSGFGEVEFNDTPSGWECRVKVGTAIRVAYTYSASYVASTINTPLGLLKIDEPTKQIPGPENPLSLSRTLAQKPASAFEAWNLRGSSN